MKKKGSAMGWALRGLAMLLAALACVMLLLPCVSLTTMGRIQVREAALEMGIDGNGAQLDAGALIAQMENEFSYLGIDNADIARLTNLVKRGVRILQNGSASPTELKGVLGDGLGAFKRAQQQFMGEFGEEFMTAETSSALAQVERANLWLTIGWWATLAVAAIAVLALALRFRFAGILQIIVMAAWPVATVLLLHRYADTLNGMATMGYGPFVGLLFAAASFALALAAGAADQKRTAKRAVNGRILPTSGGNAMGGAPAAGNGWTCPACGKRVEAHNAFCSACGTPRPSKRVCPSCGAECPDGMTFCTRCGSPVPAQSAPAQPNAYAPQSAYGQPNPSAQPSAYAPKHMNSEAQPTYVPRHLSADAPQGDSPLDAPQTSAYGDIDQTVRAQGAGGTIRLFTENAVAPLSMTITELVNGAPAQGYSVSLVGAMSIGRGPACDLQLSEGTVSAMHLKLEHTGGELIATDLNSSNGTLVNGRRIAEPTAIHSGDTLRLGNAVLQIEF